MSETPIYDQLVKDMGAPPMPPTTWGLAMAKFTAAMDTITHAFSNENEYAE